MKSSVKEVISMECDNCKDSLGLCDCCDDILYIGDFVECSDDGFHYCVCCYYRNKKKETTNNEPLN